MSTQHDIEKEQGLGPPAPSSLQTLETGRETSMPPAQTFPQPPQRSPRPPRNRWMVIGAVVVALALMVSLGVLLIPGLLQRPTSQVTPTPTVPAGQGTPMPTTPGTDVTPTSPPGVNPGPKNGPSGVSDPAYWDKILGTQAGVTKVERVSFANIMNTTSLQALVTVRHAGPDARLDVYVFNNITSATPTQLFKLSGLLKGDAKISGYSTVLTAEVDRNSGLNAGKPLDKATPDLFREFQWNSAQGKLVQVAFPGIFPDLTRYQAEADQAWVNKGHDAWKYDPAAVAKAAAVKFLQWDNASAKVLSGGGSKDVYATVRVTAPVMPNLGINVTLSRLEGNIHNLWVVIAVEDGSALTLTSIAPRSLVASPVKLEGKGAAFESQIGEAIVLDHLYTDIGHAQVSALPSATSPRPYSVGVIYNSTFTAGVQEGVIEVQLSGGGAPGISTAVMVKVLLDPVPRVALGPLACPDAVKDPAHWKQFLPSVVIPEQVGCANLLGKPTLQTVVVGREIVGGGQRFLSFYVFDDIFSAHPKLLFKVEHLLQDTKGGQGNFTISGYSTIMTAEVDRDSSINKGKPDADVTNDLFREFQWSSKANTFVQVAFPGMYPDLTRYQAELDQAWVVNMGKDTWKNDPKQVALKFVSTFIDWKYPLTATVISGGGTRDVDATVRVLQEVPGLGSKPSLTVTLSRLEGNPHNMWVVIALEKGSALLTSIQPNSLIASPVKLAGKGSAYEKDLGEAYILDHTYTKVGHAHLTLTPGMRDGPYSVLVSYDTSFKAGPQEGIVEVQQTNPIGTGPVPVVMVKVLLDPQPRVALGPVFCPLALQDPAGPLGLSGLEANCGNLKGDATLQALVARDGSISVYDHITDAQPVKIFSMKTQSAKISGVSTILTQDSALYREFQWSSKTGTFVQVAFPGMYPDLTRWQAEDSQAAVDLGQNSWKLDALQTARHFADQFFTKGATVSLVSGGKPGDLHAVVTLLVPASAGGGPGPITTVSLSRLEGNPSGVWEVTGVGSKWLLIYTPTSGSTISSPVTVTGFGPQFEAQIGVVYILDYRSQPIQLGNNFAMAPDGSSPPSKFSLDVKYTSSLPGGAQEGIVELVHTSGASFDYGVVMVKVLLNP
jgi:hypothetical protein